MALSEFYLSLIIIQDYQQYNLVGFKKIKKKFDKNLVCELGSQWFASKVKKSDLNNSDEVASLISTVGKRTNVYSPSHSSDEDRWRDSSRMSWRRETGRPPWPD